MSDFARSEPRFSHQGTNKMKLKLLSKREESIAEKIVDAAFTVHKAVDAINPVWKAQILSHLRLTGKRLGFLINFNVPLIKSGIQRIIL